MKNRSSCRTCLGELLTLAQKLNRWKRFISHRFRLRWLRLPRVYCVTTIFILACLGMTEIAMSGSFTTSDGITRNMDDVWFGVDTARTQETDLVAVSADIAALPELAGMGNVASLRQASDDSTWRTFA